MGRAGKRLTAPRLLPPTVVVTLIVTQTQEPPQTESGHFVDFVVFEPTIDFVPRRALGPVKGKKCGSLSLLHGDHRY